MSDNPRLYCSCAGGYVKPGREQECCMAPTPEPIEMAVTAARLAEERQRMAATGTGYVPHWHELTDRERKMATIEAERWLTAMRNLTNQPAPAEALP